MSRSPRSAPSMWRVAHLCESCPFARRGKGLRLARSLRRGRMAEIKRGLLAGEVFPCHQTVEYDDDGEPVLGTGLVCAGALAFQGTHGVSAKG